MLKGYKKFDMKNIMATTKMTDDELNGLYKEVKQELGYNNENLDAIFNIALLDKEKLFPNQNKKTEKECLMRWVERYKNCMENLPSQHIGTPKNTCTDPSLAKIVKASCEYSDEEIEEYEKNHNLFMAAENIQGVCLKSISLEMLHPMIGFGVQEKHYRQLTFVKEMAQLYCKLKIRIIQRTVLATKFVRGRKSKKLIG